MRPEREHAHTLQRASERERDLGESLADEVERKHAELGHKQLRRPPQKLSSLPPARALVLLQTVTSLENIGRPNASCAGARRVWACNWVCVYVCVDGSTDGWMAGGVKGCGGEGRGGGEKGGWVPGRRRRW